MKRYAKKILPGTREYYFRLLFRRVSRRKFGRFLRRLGIEEGAVVFVHTALGRLGYFPRGPIGLVELLKELVGESGTISMPVASFAGTMEDFVGSKPFFDVARTPSKVGALTECFRSYPGTVRSLHPTHSICALGARAEELVQGHEESSGPCGAESPFGRLSAMDARILRIGTGALTLYHHVQELVDYPNLFLPQTVDLPCRDYSGNVLQVRTRVYRKHIPGILFLGNNSADQLLNVHPRNFPLLYSGYQEASLRKDPKRQEVLVRLLEIRDLFLSNGWLHIGEFNECKCEVFRVKEYVDYAVANERELLATFKGKYESADLRTLRKEGGYPRG